MSARLLMNAERRMEAENYLSSGYGTRLAIESRGNGWTKLSDFARVWQPSRLKGIQVSPNFGTPFLAATQAFDFQPIPRKWLALARTQDASERFVERGLILVTCSGSVGRATLAFKPHLNTLITHDLLRIEPRDKKAHGWLYAFLRAPKARAMMTSARYGHIIKHLESSHLDTLPIPLVSKNVLDTCNSVVEQILNLRERAYSAKLEADNYFEQRLGRLETSDFGERGFITRAANTILLRGQRLDAARHNPAVNLLRRHLHKNGRTVDRLSGCGFEIWVPGRYKRIPATDGVIFVDSSDLFEINPDTSKRFADCRFGDKYRGRVQPGWLLMASSGQTYGLVGGVILSGAFHEGKVVANHVIRIIPTTSASARSGYVLVALSHPTLGRPIIKSLTFGSSVPEISPDDIADFGLVRLSERDENCIADLAEKSAELRSQADILETQLALDAEMILDSFISNVAAR